MKLPKLSLGKLTKLHILGIGAGVCFLIIGGFIALPIRIAIARYNENLQAYKQAHQVAIRRQAVEEDVKKAEEVSTQLKSRYDEYWRKRSLALLTDNKADALALIWREFHFYLPGLIAAAAMDSGCILKSFNIDAPPTEPISLKTTDLMVPVSLQISVPHYRNLSRFIQELSKYPRLIVVDPNITITPAQDLPGFLEVSLNITEHILPRKGSAVKGATHQPAKLLAEDMEELQKFMDTLMSTLEAQSSLREQK